MPGFDELTESVDVPVPPAERETLVGFAERLSPAGELVGDRVTVPAKLLRLVRVIVEVAVDPALKLRVVGFAKIEKSAALATDTWTVVE